MCERERVQNMGCTKVERKYERELSECDIELAIATERKRGDRGVCVCVCVQMILQRKTERH